MTTETDKYLEKTTAKGILGRFGHLLSAQGVDGGASAIFFLYLAWLDAGAYGQVMYAMAAGSMVMKVAQFGLYYPLVRRLGSGDNEETPALLGQVLFIKFLLLALAMVSVWGITVFRGFHSQMAWIVAGVSLGFGLEALADTFFADFRVRGRQDLEARVKIVSSIFGYGFGFLAALLGLSPVIVGLFKLVSGLVRMALGVRYHFRALAAIVMNGIKWIDLWAMFRMAAIFAAVEILGTLYNKANIFFLERASGVEGVAYYSATWNLIDPISILASESFLGWVIFPILASMWIKNREQAGRLIRANALWLMITALPIMFVLFIKSDLLIGLIYPDQYKDAVWMQKYLVWTIILSFENNLFAYVMMVTGAQRILLVFALITTTLNLVFNYTLVAPMGLAGGCLVIVMTKLTMTVLTFGYCQINFKFFKLNDIFFPFSLALTALAVYLLLSTVMPFGAGLVALAVYGVGVWKLGLKHLGTPPRRNISIQEAEA